MRRNIKQSPLIWVEENSVQSLTEDCRKETYYLPPFDDFRACIDLRKQTWADIPGGQHERWILFSSFFRDVPDKDYEWAIAFSASDVFPKTVKGYIYLASGAANDAFRIWVNGREETQEYQEDMKIGVKTHVVWLLLGVVARCSYPGNFLASVRPNKQGKSVEWARSRTHYVILHRAHPANTPELINGHMPSVEDSKKHIVRQAHSRRAHFRLLRSSKFRHKAGQRIPIKSTWVGPKEWKQGTSIYRICAPTSLPATSEKHTPPTL